MTARSTAVVTGAGSGLGREVVRRFAEQGLAVVAIGRRLGRLEETAQLCDGLPGVVFTVPADVTNGDDLARSLDRITAIADLPPIEILVNCAARVGQVGAFHKVPATDWQCTLETDLFGPATMMRLILPRMIAHGYGRVVNVSGGGATAPRADFSAYAAAKAALVRLTETVALELRSSGVVVNAVAPGDMRTELGGASLAELGRQSPEDRWPIERAAELIHQLCSVEASCVTGKLISAVHDSWNDLGQLGGQTDMYTLRRVDEHTISAVLTDRAEEIPR